MSSEDEEIERRYRSKKRKNRAPRCEDIDANYKPVRCSPRDVAWDYLTRSACVGADRNCPMWKGHCFLRHFEANASKSLILDSLEDYRLTKSGKRSPVTEDEMLRRAEDLFQTGEYEASLVLFGRGVQRWPKVRQFWCGRKKAKKAILNNIGAFVNNPFEELEKLDPIINGDDSEELARPFKTLNIIDLNDVKPYDKRVLELKSQGDGKEVSHELAMERKFRIPLGEMETHEAVFGTMEDIANYITEKESKWKIRSARHSLLWSPLKTPPAIGSGSSISRRRKTTSDVPQEKDKDRDQVLRRKHRTQSTKQNLTSKKKTPNNSKMSNEICVLKKPSGKRGEEKVKKYSNLERKEKTVPPARHSSTNCRILSKFSLDQAQETEIIPNKAVEGHQQAHIVRKTDNRTCGIEMHSSDGRTVGISYANTRIIEEVWQQEMPEAVLNNNIKILRNQFHYSRQQDRYLDNMMYVAELMQEMFTHIRNGKHDETQRLGKTIINYIKNVQEEELPGKCAYIIPAYSVLALSYLQSEKFPVALDLCNKMLNVAIGLDNPTLLALSLAVKAQTHAKVGQLRDAAETWTRMEPLIDDKSSRAWLFHELGRCHFHMGEVRAARKYGIKSQKSAKASDNLKWVMNSALLIAQTEMEIGDYNAAKDILQEAKKISIELNDERVLKYVENAERMMTDSCVPVVSRQWREAAVVL